MLADFVDKLIEETRNKEHELHGLRYTDRPLHLAKPPMPDPVVFNTLTGFAAFVNEYVDENEDFIQVLDSGIVKALSFSTDAVGQREHLATATIAHHGAAFPFGTKLAQEDFIIKVQAHFVVDENRAKVLAVAGNMTAERAVSAEDDGVSQKVGARAGVVLKSSLTVPNPVALRPYRTFLEVEQPEGQFVFRVHQDREGQLPTCALYDADGGRWRIKAIQSVAEWLKAALPAYKVFA